MCVEHLYRGVAHPLSLCTGWVAAHAEHEGTGKQLGAERGDVGYRLIDELVAPHVLAEDVPVAPRRQLVPGDGGVAVPEVPRLKQGVVRQELHLAYVHVAAKD